MMRRLIVYEGSAEFVVLPLREDKDFEQIYWIKFPVH